MGANLVHSAKDSLENTIHRLSSSDDIICVSFRQPDILIVINANEQLQKEIFELLVAHRPGTLHRPSSVCHEGTVEYSLGEDPFTSLQKLQDSVMIRKMCCELLAMMRHEGWELLTSCDLCSWTDDDLSNWYFGRAQSDLKAEIVAVGLLKSNQVLLVNGNTNLKSAVREALGSKIDKVELFEGKELCLTAKGRPWNPRSHDLSENESGRQILLKLFANFNDNFCKYIGTANIEGRADTLFFQQQKMPNTKPPPVQLAMMSLNGDAEIRFTELPSPVLDSIRQCLLQNWSAGVATEEKFAEYDSVSFKLNGSPWIAGAELSESRILVLKMFQCLAVAGWLVEASIDVSRDTDDKSSFVLRPIKETKAEFVALVPCGENLLQLINAPDNVNERMRDFAKRDEIKQYIGVNKQIPHGEQWMLFGKPWKPTSIGHRISARKLIGQFIMQLRDCDWMLMTSSALSSKSNQEEHQSESHSVSDLHTLIFAKKEDGKFFDSYVIGHGFKF